MLRARPQRRCEVARLLQQALTHPNSGLLHKLHRERVELRQAARLLVEQPASRAVRAALLVEVRDERVLGARAVVVERLALGALREELDRREAADAVFLRKGAVGCRVSIDIGDDDLYECQQVLMQWDIVAHVRLILEIQGD